MLRQKLIINIYLLHLVGLLSSYFAHDARSQEPKVCRHILSEQAVLWRDVAACGTAVPSAARIQYCLFLPTDIAVLRNEN
jgi:hypothetical protein